MNRVLIFGIIGFACTIGVPLFIANQLQLGTNAKSPQTVEIPLGGRVLIGGGRGKLWFAGGSSGGEFEIECRRETQYIAPEPGKTYQGCGMTVMLKDVKPTKPPKAVFVVEWKSNPK